MSPIVNRYREYALGWFSNEEDRPHVHVFRGNDRRASAKFWLDEGVHLAKDGLGLSDREIAELRRHIIANREELLTGWYDFFH